jgi:hypothetical protein
MDGFHRHCFAAATAASVNKGGPEIALADSTVPSVPISISTTMEPVTLDSLAKDG